MRFKLWLEISEGFMNSLQPTMDLLKPTTFSQIDYLKNTNGPNKELYIRKNMLDNIERFSRAFKLKNYVFDQVDIKDQGTEKIIDYAIKNKIISKISTNQYQIYIQNLTTQMNKVEYDLEDAEKNSKNIRDFHNNLDNWSNTLLAPSSIQNRTTAVS